MPLTPHIRMRHLRCFLAIAQHGSATRAAEALGTVQPGVSRSLRELEQQIGTPLFDRSAGGLVLNTAGKTLLSYVSNGLDHLDRGFESLQSQLKGQKVHAYVLPNVVRTIMPGAVRRFKSLQPDVDVTFLTTTSGGFHQVLAKGEVDFGFGRLLSVEHMEGMNFEHLFTEPLVFFARAGHPLAGQPDLTIEQINRFEVILPISGTVIRNEIDRFVIAHGLPRFANVIETISFEFARSYIAAGDAIVIHPLGAMRRELDEGRVEQLDFGRTEMRGAVGITTPAHRKPSPAASLLIQTIRDEVAEQGLS